MLRPSLVLAYHGLGRFPRALDPHNLMVDPGLFHRQLLTLARRRYRFVRLIELVAQLDGGAPPEGLCALTFDDGTLDNLHVLKPILERMGVPATVYACPALLGERQPAMAPATGVRFMNGDELRELASSPLVEIGSHTRSHNDLSASSAEEAEEEMVASKRALEELLQRPVLTFAYPRCAYSPACPDAARRAGYVAAVTCGNRGGWLPFELARQSVDSLDRRITFALKSRHLFFPARESHPVRALRRAARPLRHGRAGHTQGP